MATTIAIANHKGGVGKTTTAINIGAGLARRNYRTLLVDMDAQANLTDTLRVSAEHDIYGMLKGQLPIVTKVRDYLDVLPATLDLATADIELSTAIGRETLLKEVLAGLKEDYDYIIIDTAPTLGLLTINSMAAADAVIIPLQAEYYALKGIKGLVAVIDSVAKRINKRLHVGGVIVTQYDTRTTLHRQIREQIGAQFALNMFRTSVRKTIAIAEAQTKGCDIFTYAPDSAGAQDYSDIVAEFIKRFDTEGNDLNNIK